MFDSHCHLNDTAYDKDIGSVLQRAADAGVAACMTIGINAESSRKAAVLAGVWEPLYASVGVHPHDAESCSESVLDTLKGLTRQPKVKAWGEIGLDYNRMFSARSAQEKWFQRQLAAGVQFGLPVILHERDTNGRLLKILEEFAPSAGLKGVVHCFTGTRTDLTGYLDLGLHIGITGILTIQGRGRFLRELVRHIPVERLLIETDAPYLTPAPEKNRFRRNEPAFVKSVLLKLAEVREEVPEELAETIWHNTCALFSVDAAVPLR